MNKSVSFSLDNVKQPALKFLRRYHLLLFFLVVSAALFTAIVILLQITNLGTNDPSNSAAPVDTSFDEATIERIQTLGEPRSYNSGNRKSPFSE